MPPDIWGMVLVLALLALLCSALFGEGGKGLPENLNRVGFTAQLGQYMFDDRASFLSRTYLQSMLDFEFRLYWWNDVKDCYLRFTINSRNDRFETHDLLTESDDARFDRFLFWKLLRRDSLISVSGKPELWRVVERWGACFKNEEVAA